MKISTILDQVDLGAMALPEFQRGYVWNRDQVRGLMHSLYHKYPVGSLLVWVTKTDTADARGDGPLSPGVVQLLLDGQQRITSLYGLVRGKPPKFFDGNAQAFTGLYFNLEDEAFEFYAPLKMKDNPLWVDVTALMQSNVAQSIQQLMSKPDLQSNIGTYINRLNSIDQIKQIELHIEQVTGEDKTVDIVVDIFNKVNSGGTKLSKGDLALARICAAWPDARPEMKNRLHRWDQAGFPFKLDWFLRVINAILTGNAMFTALKDVTVPQFRDGLTKSERSIDWLLNLISSRLGVDHGQVLGSVYSFPLLAYYINKRGGQIHDYREQDKLLYWYVHTFLWGRYAGSTETVLAQDLAAVRDGSTDPLGDLIALLRQNRGDLTIHPSDFSGWSLGARFYPLLYLLTRTWGAQDWCSGIKLSQNLLGKFSNLHLHHIFPKAYLYQHGYDRPEVNALANFAFLTAESNLKIGDRPPHKYFEEVAGLQPGALESQWIPMDRELWRVENYREFLQARRELLAQAANDFLESLLHGEVIDTGPAEDVTRRVVQATPGAVPPGDEEQAIMECIDWVTQQGLSSPELSYELVEQETNAPLAVFDLAWPDGLQEGLTEPVAVLIDEPAEVHDMASRVGYRYFTSVEVFKSYVLKEVLHIDPLLVAQ